MVLSQVDLRKEIRKGSIVFDPPIEDTQYGEASIDLRLGFSFTKFKDISHMKISVAAGLGNIGHDGFWNHKILQEKDEFGKRQSFDLEPGEFVLCMSHEIVAIPKHLIAMVEGRSTYARVGLGMHITAPWIQPGWSGQITLEIMNHGPLTIELTPLIDRPCQLTFLQLKTPLPTKMSYGARETDIYQHQTHPLKHRTGNTSARTRQNDLKTSNKKPRSTAKRKKRK